MTTWTEGDTAPDLTGTCWADADNTTPANLTGASLQLHIRRTNGTTLTATPTIVDPVAGTWTYRFVSGDLSGHGPYEVAIIVTYTNGTVQTFGPTNITVNPTP